jgi:regulatory protein YycH of two-component signal transduction system YycFG
MVGRPNKEHIEDISLLIVIAAVLVYAVWKIAAEMSK